MAKAIYEETKEQIITQLDVDPQKGLTSEEAGRRLIQYGSNVLREKKRQSWFSKLLNQFKDTMVLILIAACVLSAFFQEWVDALVILAIVIINAVLGLIQEGRAERAIEALQKMTSPQARVLRNGQQQAIPAADLVPGDLVLLEAGDLTPADIRLTECSSLKAEEASLTGESMPVEKNADKVLPADTPLGDRYNLVFMSTPITYGRGRGLVYATGSKTEIGQIADRLQSIQEEATPLQRSLNQLGKWLGLICMAVCAIVFLQGILMKGAFLQVFMTAISLAVAAIPEGLPAVVTIVLAMGMKRMAERHAIVKRLLAVETLGSVDVICSDKTGTLTQNEMTVTQLYYENRGIDVEGRGYRPEGRLLNPTTHEQAEHNAVLDRLLTIGVLCNDAALVDRADKETGILGDPTEAALLVVGAKAGLHQQPLKERYPRIADLPFDSERKMMTTVHRGFSETGLLSLTKGAPDIVLNRCCSILTEDGPQPLTDRQRAEILEANHRMAVSALRILAFACKVHAENPLDPEQDMIFVGLMGMIDPARPEVRDAIALCAGAGIRPVMITGDYRDTAVAIAQDLGMMKPGDEVMTGAEIDQLSEQQLQSQVEKTVVYARVSPDHKVKIVTALRSMGHIASMTGDGVNDAMALKSADIGVAMGITGTDVAKGTADMILTDDNFATIVAAVREGRIIYSNIRKFVGFLLSCNVGEILVIFLSTLFLGPQYVPLLPIQLLWLNLVTDSFPALALGQEKGEPDIMRQKPRGIKEPIMNRLMLSTILIQSLAIFGAVFSAFQIGMRFYPGQGEASSGARTFAFATLILAELLRSYSARSEKHPVWRLGLFSNHTLNKAVGISGVLLLLAIYVPFLNPVFSTIQLVLADWLVIVPLAFVPFAIAEISKWLIGRKG
ncbi:MAG: cation-translocating P-type ATPase [Clostridiaceae bacterium]|nr:cation-translocating P-type ATPase [Clostridiaceae bacterium]